MTEAKNKEVLATTRTSEWFEDFLVAIKASEFTNATKIAKGSFGPFGDEYTNASRVANGSFDPTFADEGNDHSREGIEDEASTKRKGKTHLGRHSYKRQNASDSSDKVNVYASGKKPGKVETASDEPGKVCRACAGPHPAIPKCYYLFPSKAPKYWTPKPHVQKLVEEALKEDSALKEEVERYKRTKRAKINDDEG
jgi:hypothetical protein